MKHIVSSNWVCKSVVTFPVYGETSNARRQKVKDVFDVSPMAGFLLASVNLEWTLRRSILALGKDPTKQIRYAFRKKHGIDGYKQVWKNQISRPFGLPGLYELVEKESRSRKFFWTDVRQGFEVRNVLVHGRSCTQGEQYLRRYANIFIDVAEILVSFVAANGKSIYTTIRRIKPAFSNKQQGETTRTAP